jgi:guanylate kinase
VSDTKEREAGYNESILVMPSKSTVSEHLTNIFANGELDESSTVRNFRTVASNGKAYNFLQAFGTESLGEGLYTESRSPF